MAGCNSAMAQRQFSVAGADYWTAYAQRNIAERVNSQVEIAS
jgi:hypothetical protein